MSAGKSESCRAGWTLRQEPMLLEVEFLLPQGNFGLTLKVFQLTGRGSLSLTFSLSQLIVNVNHSYKITPRQYLDFCLVE